MLGAGVDGQRFVGRWLCRWPSLATLIDARGNRADQAPRSWIHAMVQRLEPHARKVLPDLLGAACSHGVEAETVQRERGRALGHEAFAGVVPLDIVGPGQLATFAKSDAGDPAVPGM